jgi:hypothetical protein
VVVLILLYEFSGPGIVEESLCSPIRICIHGKGENKGRGNMDIASGVQRRFDPESLFEQNKQIESLKVLVYIVLFVQKAGVAHLQSGQ